MKKSKVLTNIALGLISAILTSLPIEAAERIHFIYPPFNWSLQVDSLEKFATEDIINSELADYFRLANLNETQKAEFRQALLKKADIDPLQLHRFLNTPTGEKVLERLGILISIRGGSNGKYALRAAIMQAALDPQEGLTLLNLLRKFPVDMQLNIAAILEAANLVQLLNSINNTLVDKTALLSENEAEIPVEINFSELPDIRKPGNYGVREVKIWHLKDPKREREFYVLVYLPQRWRENKTPVVIISHGLGSRPEDFAHIAKHLASHGYLVALPQHPGSDYQQFQAMLQGYSRRLYEVSEFIDRPQDVSYFLDELERRNQTEFSGRLDLEKVGVLGHSFGGYTALALAGASINFEQLSKVCQPELWSPNLSLILQCSALNLPHKDYDFRDERVKSIFIVNPLTRHIFGTRELNKITIPVIIGAGSQDPATPAPIEQIPAFIDITSSSKYLMLVVGQAHVNFSNLDASVELLFNSLPDFTKPDQSLINTYGYAFTLAFFEVYIANNQSYNIYLQSAYADYISQKPNPLYFVDESGVIPLVNLYNNKRPHNINPILWPIMLVDE